MAHHPTLDLLDVRTPDEFAEVRVPRARNIPLGILLAGKLLAEKAGGTLAWIAASLPVQRGSRKPA